APGAYQRLVPEGSRARSRDARARRERRHGAAWPRRCGPRAGREPDRPLMSREVRSVASERRRRRPAVAAATATGRALALTVAATFAACTGDGSDIGPDLQRLPSA